MKHIVNSKLALTELAVAINKAFSTPGYRIVHDIYVDSPDNVTCVGYESTDRGRTAFVIWLSSQHEKFDSSMIDRIPHGMSQYDSVIKDNCRGYTVCAGHGFNRAGRTNMLIVRYDCDISSSRAIIDYNEADFRIIDDSATDSHIFSITCDSSCRLIGVGHVMLGDGVLAIHNVLAIHKLPAVVIFDDGVMTPHIMRDIHPTTEFIDVSVDNDDNIICVAKYGDDGYHVINYVFTPKTLELIDSYITHRPPILPPLIIQFNASGNTTTKREFLFSAVNILLEKTWRNKL